MIKLLRFLWTGSWHEHKWKNLNRTPVYEICRSQKVSELPMYYEYIQQCEHCGAMKKFTA